MVDDTDPTIPDELIEEYLRFLRDGGPEPDLSDLDDEVSSAAANALRVVEALVDAATRLSAARA